MERPHTGPAEHMHEATAYRIAHTDESDLHQRLQQEQFFCSTEYKRSPADFNLWSAGRVV